MDCNSLITTRKRLLILVISIVFFFFVLFGRLACVQIVSGRQYSARAAEQWYRDLPLDAKRGVIYDKSGNVIAGNMTVYTVYVRPGSVKDARNVADVLSERLNVDRDKLLQKIERHSVSEITVKRGVDEATGKALMELNLPGVYFSVGYTRSYPHPEYLAQVVGFTNIDGDGQNGLEGYYDKYLKGVDGQYLVQSDNRGGEITSGERYYVPPIQGADIITTVDINLQAFCEEAVSQATMEWQAKGATMLIMEADSGAIAAMAQSPSYLLDDLPRDDVEMLNAYSKNKMIVDVYEPGSTFKIFTTATAIEKGVVTSASRFYCPGYRIVDGQRIRCWRTIGHGSQNLAEGVQNSCNCVFMDLALKLGTDNLYDGLNKFGFGSKTGIDFFGESSGIMMKRDGVKNVDLARIGFGQAVAVTPVQLAAGACAVVNGGKKVTPHFVDRIESVDGREIYRFTDIKQQILSAETSSLMRELLLNVVNNGGGKKAAVEGYEIGGKTGTAQKYENGAIASGKYVSSFVGFAPADDPKYVILMTVDEPTAGAYYGSIVAAPYVGRVFSKIFYYEQIEPTTPIKEEEYVVMPQLEGLSVGEALSIAQKTGLYCECAGEGAIVQSTLPIAGEKIKKGDVVLLRS